MTSKLLMYLSSCLLCRGRKIPRPGLHMGNRGKERPRSLATACKVGLLHHQLSYSVPSREWPKKFHAPGRWGKRAEDSTGCGQQEGGAGLLCSKEKGHVEEAVTSPTILGIENKVPWCIIKAKHEGT